jgi:hypothetical protein
MPRVRPRVAALVSTFVSAAAVLVACSGGRTGSADAGTEASGIPLGTLVPGAPCDTPGLLYCEIGTGELVLFCGALTGSSVSLDTGVLTDVFQCPPGQACVAGQDRTSVECTASVSKLVEQYAIAGAPCSGAQSAACSFDARKYLACEQGTWQVKQDCGRASCALDPPGYAGCTAPAGTNGCLACH